jgi:protein ImuB
MARRIASLWFPRLAAERRLRLLGPVTAPFAVVAEARGALHLASLSVEAEAAGLSRGMGLADARAICPTLATAAADPPGEAAFLAALRRWAMRYSPWVAAEGAEAMVLDVTGCAHLFGGEAAMLADMQARLAAAGLTVRAACADTRGAAWALARYAAGEAPGRSGGAVAVDAPASRVRNPAAAVRPSAAAPMPRPPVIAPAGHTRAMLAPLPVAALRLSPEAVEGLARLGLRCVGEIAGLPRGGLARRFGIETMRRLDQALGAEPEPVAVAGPEPVRAVRLSLPEPISRTDDVAAALDRLLGRLAAHLDAAGAGARRLRLTVRRVDGRDAAVEIGLARPSRDVGLIARLFARPVGEIDAGFGIDALRLEAVETEPLAPVQHRGHLAARAEAEARATAGGGEGFAALLSKLGNRLGFERLERYLPADSHIPARAFTVASAAFAAPAEGWPAPPRPRPILLFDPEPITPEAPGTPPGAFRWRARTHRTARAFGPERIAPAWWLDDPPWRTGPRDYWRVETATGLRLWLFHTAQDGAWQAEGEFG